MINRDLFMAILAMDSYNRGNGKQVNASSDSSNPNNEIGRTIGNAVIFSQDISSIADSAGYYAIAYNVSSVAGFSAGEKVISYRGTNTDSLSALGRDIIDGWTVGAGSPAEVQAKLATQFFNSVNTGAGDPRLANITLTGHSLGGGLAGW